MDLGKSPRDNDLITIFCNTAYQNIQTMRHKPCSHWVNWPESIRWLFQQLSDISLCKKLKFTIMEMQDSSTNGLACDKVLDWNPLCIFNIFWQKKLLTRWAISLSELILFGSTVWPLCNTLLLYSDLLTLNISKWTHKLILIHSHSQYLMCLYAAGMFLLYHGSIGLLGICFVLKGACSYTMYYHRDPPDDPHHPVDPIPEKRLADQQEKPRCQMTYIFYMK